MPPKDERNDFEWLSDRIKYLEPEEDIISCDKTCYHVGMWSPLKTVLLSYYYAIFTDIASKHTDNMIYIDLLAGSGIVNINGTDSKIIGSPLVAVYFARHPFSKMFLAESNESSREALEKRLQIVMQKQDLDYQNIVGKIYPNAFTATQAAIKYMNDKVRNHNGVLNLCLVDYEGFNEVPFDLIKKISKFHGDTIINFQTHQIARILTNKNSDLLTSFLGTDEWKHISSDNYRDTLQLYQNQLKKEDRPIFEAVEINSETAYYYHLIFACRSTAKGSQWMKAIRRIKPKIESSNARTVKEIYNIIKGNQSQLTDF